MLDRLLRSHHERVFNRCLPWSGGYRHFNSHLEDFYAGFEALRVASVNNRALDLDRLGRFRVSRFIRDPRDLVVSGYFYHRRGAEPWLTAAAPTDADWYFANGRVPEGLRAAGSSFAEYLRSVPEEQGLLAELEFRGPHFESMARWPAHHPHIATSTATRTSWETSPRCREAPPDSGQRERESRTSQSRGA